MCPTEFKIGPGFCPHTLTSGRFRVRVRRGLEPITLLRCFLFVSPVINEKYKSGCCRLKLEPHCSQGLLVVYVSSPYRCDQVFKYNLGSLHFLNKSTVSEANHKSVEIVEIRQPLVQACFHFELSDEILT